MATAIMAPKMHFARVTIRGISPYSQSRFHETPKKNKETHAGYEKRTWRERMHVNKDGNVIIPQMALKNCLSEAAKYTSRKQPGKGNETYTKHFDAGIAMESEVEIIGVKAKNVQSEELFLNADGKPGGGKRVLRTYPRIEAGWEADVTFLILDETVTEDIFMTYLVEAGRFIGIGRHRPRNRGTYGRFEVVKFKWE